MLASLAAARALWNLMRGSVATMRAISTSTYRSTDFMFLLIDLGERGAGRMFCLRVGVGKTMVLFKKSSLGAMPFERHDDD
jgi:hypothetical protein